MAEILMTGSGTKGYGTAGASTNRRATKGFRAMSGSPREDIDYNNYTLRQRGRLMYMGNPIASSAVKTHRTNTVGLGLKPNPRPDTKFLNVTDEDAAEWANHVKREFALWASRKDSCDATGINDFYELQQMLLTSWLTSGDVFVLVQQAEETWRSPYSLRLRALEADRVATPFGDGTLSVPSLTTGMCANGNLIYDGIEIDRSGRVVAYHIRNTYPFEVTLEQTKFERIEARGRRTELPNVLHIMNAERPDQYRGITYLAPCIIQLLQLNRYTEAEITAAVIESFFTAFITTSENADDVPFNEATPYGEVNGEGSGVSYDPNDYELGPGTLNVMNPGEDVKFGEPTRPAGGFAGFVDAIATQVGASLEIPKDLLMKSFNASYSASRGALLEAWKSFKMYRTWFANDFCKPVYELWMSEAVAKGRVSAPGFFTDPAVREAWLKVQWVGPSQGQLDPKKEVEAEILAISNGFTTREDAALRLNGSDFNDNMEQLRREQDLIDELEPGTPEIKTDEESEEEGDPKNDDI